MPTPQTIQIFLPSGDPQGLRQAEITTRTVRLFDVPRTALREFLKRPESDHPGLYFLFGQEDDQERESCYIGESEDVGKRIGEHDTGKEFWDRALIAVSLTNTWTKAHIRFMETNAMELAKAAGRFHTTNANKGFSTFMPEPAEADCVEYLDIVSTLTATLGFPVMRATQTRLQTQPSNVLHLRLKALRDVTSGTYGADGFTVFKGTRLQVTGNPVAGQTVAPGGPYAETYEAQRSRLLEEGILAWQDGELVFARDHVFKSPSGAAGCIIGRNANGWVEWLNDQGSTLAAIERSDVASETTASAPAAAEGE